MSGQLSVAESRKAIIAQVVDDKFKKQLAMALPKHLTIDRFVRCVLSQLNKTPTLLECDPGSIAIAVLNAGEMGLEPNGRDGHLVPYKVKGAMRAQFIPDYKGLIRLAYQSDMVTLVQAQAVYEKDLFGYKFGSGAYIEHVPSQDEDRGALCYAWAMAKLTNGGEPFVVLNKGDIARRRKAAMGANSEYSPWNQHAEAMWRKSAVRELAKWIPQSPRLERAVNAENEAGDPLDVLDDLGGEETPEQASANDVGSARSQADEIERRLREKQEAMSESK